MSDPSEDETTDPHTPRGAACMEIITESEPRDTMLSEIEGISELRSSQRSSPTFPALLRDLYHPPRRYSTFLTPHDVHYPSRFQRTQRHASLPFISPDNIHHLNIDDDIKKMFEESSRRSSLESAYGSQRSDPISRTTNNSHLEFANPSQFLSNQTYGSDENLERITTERRDSLSYEAIRAYFLERNPYAQEIEQPNRCLDHRMLGTSLCPTCRRRRSSFGLGNIHFRTNAHQAVIERQFDDLSNIPDQRQSRSTSIDLFGGLGVPIPISDTKEDKSVSNKKGIDGENEEIPESNNKP